MYRILQSTLFLPLLACLGCGEEWVPLGTFDLIQVWKDGDCGLVSPTSFTVRMRAADPSSGLEGLISTDPSGMLNNIDIGVSNKECLFAFTLLQPAGDFFLGETFSTFEFVERDGDINGSGNIVVGAPDNCGQDFEIEGSRSE